MDLSIIVIMIMAMMTVRLGVRKTYYVTAESKINGDPSIKRPVLFEGTVSRVGAKG